MAVMVHRWGGPEGCCQSMTVSQSDVPAPILEWLAAHAIDPATFFAPGSVHACDESRQVRYDALTDDDGREVFSPDGDLLVAERVVQLEARPRPMPTECNTDARLLAELAAVSGR